MAKAVLIVGIDARSPAIDNFFHFTVGALFLLVQVFTAPNAAVVSAMALIYSIPAILFGVVFFTPHLKTNHGDTKQR